MAPPRPRSRPELGTGALPVDALYEILIRLPAKDLCRLRAVCRPWRSLLSDPHFIAAHAARHPGPLFVAGHRMFSNGGALCDIVDLSGRVVKRIPWTGDGAEAPEWVVSTQHDLACVAVSTTSTCRLLNLATGAVFPLPVELSEEYMPRELEFWQTHRASLALGQVPSTGEYKLLRVINNCVSVSSEQLCEVYTFGASGSARWRGKKASPDKVDMRTYSRVAVNGVVYFFLDDGGHGAVIMYQEIRPKRIASFDLLAEEWRVTLRGPAHIAAEEELCGYADLSLVALNGSLVVVHTVLNTTMNLWFLMDFEKGLWVKQHTVQVNLCVEPDEYLARPVSMLNDGRIVVTHIGSRGLLRIYDPRTSTYTDVAEMRTRVGVTLYTGNLLTI